MATLKHLGSKNADYGAAEQYLLFEHDEFTMKPVLDENGRLIPREDYRLSTLNCGGEDFAVACIENQTMRASGEPPTAYGRYENIFLSKDEYDELQAEYPDRLERLIEEMSHYLAASGKAYQNYAAALHRWAANDKKGAVKQGIPDYTCMEGESL